MLKPTKHPKEREEDEEESGAAQADSTTMWVDKHVGETVQKDMLDVCLILQNGSGVQLVSLWKI